MERITKKQIEKLMTEAAEAGDIDQVMVCRRALQGIAAAIRECARAIADAKAKQ